MSEDPRWDKLTDEQRRVLVEYKELAEALHDKGENAEYEAMELKEWAGNIREFIEGVLNGEHYLFAYIQDLSQKPYDICNIDLYDWQGGGKRGDENLSDKLMTLEEKVNDSDIFPEPDEEDDN
ncbi:MAG: hypothetical protein ACTSPB_26280 [Candidatus Thorarchaeota archaeon]